MGKKLFEILLLVSFILPGMLYSQAKTGTTSLNFLKMDVSARANAMAGAFIGISDDASCLYYNPAGMINMENMEIIASHNLYAAETGYSYGGIVVPMKAQNAAFGIQASYFNSGDIDERTPLHPQGTGRTFAATDLMVGVSYAQMLTPKFFVGGTLKFLTESLADETVYTAAGDVGTYYDTGWKSLIFGMSIRNFGGNVKFIKEDNPLPMTFLFGINYAPLDDGINKINFLMEAAHPSDNNEYVLLGLEYSFEKTFFIRAGRKLDEEENWIMQVDRTDFANDDDEAGTEVDFKDDGINWTGTTLGLGFNLQKAGLKVDYAWENLGSLGVTHMVTFGYELR